MKSTRIISWTLLILVLTCSWVTALGLPGEYLVTARWRDLFGYHSPLSNPAFTSQENYLSLRMAFAPVVQGEFKLWEAGATLPLSLRQTIGLTLMGEDDGAMESGVADNSGRIVASGKFTRNVNSFLLGSYSYSLWKSLTVGTNVGIAYQSNFGTPLYGLGLDLGVSYLLLKDSVFGEHLIGLSAQNILAPAMSPNNMFAFFDRGAYSKDLRISWNGSLQKKTYFGGVDVDIKDFWAGRSIRNTTSISNEINSMEYNVSARVGVCLFHSIILNLQMGFNRELFDYWGFAVGTNIPSANSGRDLSQLYQFSLNSESSIASSHTFYIRVETGRNRMDRHRLGLAFSPNKLYNKARNLYSQNKFWDAFFVFGQISAMYPDFFKIDWVHYYMGNCLEMLDMRKAAESQYGNMKKRMRRSPAITPLIDLGLMRLYYRKNDEEMVNTQFVQLCYSDVPDSIKYHASYLMGESNMRLRKYDNAVRYLVVIPKDHPDYIYAQHTLGIAYILLNMPQKAAPAFENCIEADNLARTEAHKEMVNRTLIMYGYLCFESGAYGKAIQALSIVPKGSYYYEDALLGKAWAEAKNQEWSNCATSGGLLNQVSQKGVLKLEGKLLQGYAAMKEKDINKAYSIFDDAFQLAKTIAVPSEDEIKDKEDENSELRGEYEDLGKTIGSDAELWKETVVSSAKEDSLSKIQQQDKKGLDDFALYFDELRRKTFFNVRLKDVMYDIEYALATVQRLKSVTPAEKKTFEKQKQLDQQIEKLNDELKRLEP